MEELENVAAKCWSFRNNIDTADSSRFVESMASCQTAFAQSVSNLLMGVLWRRVGRQGASQSDEGR